MTRETRTWLRPVTVATVLRGKDAMDLGGYLLRFPIYRRSQ